jgi:hypothetical protein
MPALDCSGLDPADVERVNHALATGERDLNWCLAEKGFAFVLRNYRELAELGFLEESWGSAYLHSSHFNETPLDVLQAVFDACDRTALQKLWPVPTLARVHRQPERISLFRGCAGPEHRMGMSWLTSLDKAIWYAAHHVAYYNLTSPAVYATTVGRDEIYCCFDHYDHDYIVRPQSWWLVDVRPSEFRLDRVR